MNDSNMRNTYQSPEIKILDILVQERLLAASSDGYSNIPSFEEEIIQL